MTRRIIALGLLIAAAAAVAAAIKYAVDKRAFSPGLPPAAQFSATLLAEPEGAVSWSTLAEVGQTIENDKEVPEFSRKVLKLNDKKVTIFGFIIPLETGTKQRHFLLSAVPPGCPFCMPTGPEGIVEILSKDPVEYGDQPIAMVGRFAVLKNDPNVLLYKLSGATPVDISTTGKPRPTHAHSG
jgi:uncharacterized protein